MKSKFDTMTRQELRAYILKNREDEQAFQVYLDRVMAQPGEIYPAPKTIEDLENFPKLLDKNQDNQSKTRISYVWFNFSTKPTLC